MNIRVIAFDGGIGTKFVLEPERLIEDPDEFEIVLGHVIVIDRYEPVAFLKTQYPFESSCALGNAVANVIEATELFVM